MEIPVVILNWNGLTDTIECVHSVLLQSEQNFVIYLIDNGSNNNELEKLDALFNVETKVRFIQNKTNVGFGEAHNRMFEQLISDGYEYVALINNDAVADGNWLKQAVYSISSPNVDVVACKMVNYYDRSKLDSAALFMLNTGEILPRGHGEFESKYSTADSVISFCAGACLLKLDMIKEIGGFDNFFDTGYEDAELGLRAYVAGKTIVFDPKSIVYHKMGQSLKKVVGYERVLKIQEDVNYTYLKLMPLAVVLGSFPLYIVRTILLLFVHAITFRGKFIQIYCKALYRTFTISRKIYNARKQCLHSRSCFEICMKQKLFLIHDLKRLYLNIIRGRKNKLEMY